MEYLIDKEHKVFTCKHPKNTFIIDYSNGYPVKLTTNVKKSTSWQDILKGKYDYANINGTPEHLNVDDDKYTYIDYNYAINVLGYSFRQSYSFDIQKYKSKLNKKAKYLFKKVL